jgi:hypothetical protein
LDSRIHSNWYNLLKEIDDSWKRVVDVLIEHGFNKVSLSLAHHDFDKNKKLMNFKWSYQWLDEEAIEDLGELSDKCSIRLSCFINKTWIWSIDDVKDYIQFGRENNISNFMFILTGFTSKEDFIENWLEDHMIISSISELWEILEIKLY